MNDDAIRHASNCKYADYDREFSVRRTLSAMWCARLVCISFLLAAVAGVGCIDSVKGRSCWTENVGSEMFIGQISRLVNSEVGQELRLNEHFHFGPFPPLPRTQRDMCSVNYFDRQAWNMYELVPSLGARSDKPYLLGLHGINGPIEDVWLVEPMWHFVQMYSDNPSSHRYVEVFHTTAIGRDTHVAPSHLSADNTPSPPEPVRTTLVVRTYVDRACDGLYAISEVRFPVEDGRLLRSSEREGSARSSPYLLSCPYTSQGGFRFLRRCG